MKGIQLEGLRVMGNPQEFAREYYHQGADEIIYMDIVASLYQRNSLLDIVSDTVKDVFIPITVGGGVRSVEDVIRLLRGGADKVAINTAATKDPELIRQVANQLGSQCMVLSIEAKLTSSDAQPEKWEAYTDNGREPTGLDVIEWAQQAVELGAGEILVTSVDRDGTKRGFDVELIKRLTQAVPVPVIASGGMGSLADFSQLAQQANPDAIAIANVLHYKKLHLDTIRSHARSEGFAVRKFEWLEGQA